MEAIYTWKDFQEKFKVRFRPSRGSSAVDYLMNIRQAGTVDEYRDRFEELTVELPPRHNRCGRVSLLEWLEEKLERSGIEMWTG